MSRRVLVWVAVLGCVIGVFSVAAARPALAAGSVTASGSVMAAGAVTATTAVPPVTHLAARSVTPSALILTWRWPSASTVTRVVVRMATGRVAPANPAAGRSAGTASRPASTLRVRNLSAHTRYAFAVFARNKSGKYSRAAAISVVTQPLPLRVATSGLPAGTRGLRYLQAMSASGGVAPYRWSAAGLPRGLSLSSAGVISGYPLVTGTRTVTVRVRDARSVTVTRKLRLAVPDSLPAGCVARSCAQLLRNTHTVQVPGRDVVSVTRSPATGKVDAVVLSGITVAVGDVLVLPADSVIPSGLIAGVSSLTKGAPGQVRAAVTEATPAAAYYQGTVQSVAPAPARPVIITPRAASLNCGASVTAEVHGLTVKPALQAAIGLSWKHNIFGRKGVYAGWGGLKLFQVDLTGKVTVDLGASISGKAKCTLNLPKVHDYVPAGDLGVVYITYAPSITLAVSGAIAVDTSVTLTCTAGYEWNKGRQSYTDFCTPSHSPLQITSDSGLDTTLTGGIGVSAALDDLPGIKGSIDDSLHLGYHPKQKPVAELDATSDYDLKATLANIWKGAPTLTIAKGEFFHAVLATWGTPPPGDSGPPSISVSPDLVLTWSDSVCGFDTPSGGWSNTFTVSGTGFQPGEKVTIVTGWETYPGQVTAAWDGSFTVTEFAGEVPSVLYQQFGVYAEGSAGSFASSSVTLDSSGCVYPADNGGTITMIWGGNGDDPGSEVDLYINDVFQDSAITDSLGSGGSTTTFSCPASGSYTWSVGATVNGGPVATPDQTMYCTPASGTASGPRSGPAAAARSRAVAPSGPRAG